MKKKIMIFLLLVVLFPFPVYAVPEVKETKLVGPDNIPKKTNFSVTFGIDFSGVEKDTKDGQGIAGVAFEIEYDENILSLIEVKSQDNTWQSYEEEEEGVKYIYSVVTESNQANNKCTDGILNCTNYLVTIHFYLKDTKESTTDIRIGEAMIMPLDKFDLEKENIEEELNNLEEKLEKNAITINVDRIKTITIQETITTPEKEPEPSINKEKPELNLNQIITEKVENIKKIESNNTYLKSLTVENYELNFRKTKKEYNIEIEETVNQLNIKVELEDEKSTYKIIGADDLKSNNNQVKIEVTSENGEKDIYTINAQLKEEEVNGETLIIKKEKKNDFKINIDRKYLIIGGIGLTLLLILIIIIRKIMDRKIDKTLDKML